MSWIKCFLVLLVVSLSAYAKSRRVLPESALDGKLLWGECILAKDPAKAAGSFPVFCGNAMVSSQVLLRNDVGDQSKALNYGWVYTGLHVHRYLSLHGEWEAKRIFDLARKNSPVVINENNTRNAFLQLGNNGLDKLRLSFGQLDLPFGINFTPISQIYREMFSDLQYWRSPRWGTKVTFDSLVSSQYDIGYGTSRLSSEEDPSAANTPENEAVSLRSMFDIAALDGFRFIFSGYGDRVGQRRMGAGFVTTSRKGDQTAFEWVRLRHSPDNKLRPYSQIFRLGHLSTFRASGRWAAEYEDDLDRYRLTTIGHDFKLPDYGLFRLSVSYHLSTEPFGKDFWFVVGAVQLSI